MLGGIEIDFVAHAAFSVVAILREALLVCKSLTAGERSSPANNYQIGEPL